MRKIFTFVASLLLLSCSNSQKTTHKSQTMSPAIQSEIVSDLKQKYPDASALRIERGVKQAAELWKEEQGNEAEFKTFCMTNFVADSTDNDRLFEKLQRNYEILWGNYGIMGMQLNEPIDLTGGTVEDIDLTFGAYSPSAHLVQDLYENKVAFITALNFPQYSLDEKNKLGKTWSQRQWAYARMGEMFTARIPSELNMSMNKASSDADVYIASYNVPMGELRNNDGEQLFPKGMNLLTHWNLRDEIKANYSDKEKGLEKQLMVYEVMKRIIDQSIPSEVINNENYQWNPYTNELSKDGNSVAATPENGQRYQQILNLFNEMQKQDAMYPEAMNNYIKRKFDGEMEISQEQCEELFTQFVSSPQAKKVGEIISARLGRPLQPFDIWYDGFKSRSSLDQKMLNSKTMTLYPNAQALEDDIERMLMELGYTKERATYLADKIAVDPARGSGHARGGTMRGDKAHLRTRIGDKGMDYKGYNIAVHELGHNVEQTISLYDVNDYMLNGVPNTSFTEALAFMFQQRDLDLLDIKNKNTDEDLETLDTFVSLYEIMGVSLVDMRVWKWMYENPNADAQALQNAVQNIAKAVWNEYYAPVFGMTDQPILAIYSHMISYPLYLSAYSFGHLIHYQLENHLANLSPKEFANEIDRIYMLGRLTPDRWMEEAVGETISIRPVLDAVDKIDVKKYTDNN